MFKNIRISTLLFLLSSSLLTVLFAKQVRADCTKWHPHHCAQEKLENTPFDPNTWNPVDWVNSGAGELCETNSIATAQRNRDREQGLHPIQKEYLRPYFGNLVDEVTVKWGSLLNDEWTFQGRTVEAGSAGQTYGNTIYIAKKRQPRSTSQLTLLAHEFRHVQQYRQRGNLDNFCREYMTAYANAQFNYENNSFERDAYGFDYKFASELKDKIPSSYSYNYEYTHSTPNWNKRSAVVLPTELPDEISDNRHVDWSNNLGDRIQSHREMPEGSFLQSGDGRFKMVVQGDGNLVIYQSNQPIWASNTGGIGTPGFKLAVQSDGNIVMYGKNAPIWASNTNGVGIGSYTLVMQNDGNLVLYDQNSSIWASGTCCR